MGGACGAYRGGERGAQVSGGETGGKDTIGERRRWEDNIKMDLQEMGEVLGIGWSWLRIGTGGGHL